LKVSVIKISLIYLIITCIFVGYDVFYEIKHFGFSELHDFFHIFLELFIFIFSLIGLFYLYNIYLTETQAKEDIKNELIQSKNKLSNISERIKAGKSEFRKLINWQFDDWCLSESEKEIGLLLLKGLSFDEIATIRNTSSKTVRKQATSIYSKTKLNNRNEFSAWFLEDLL